VHVHVRVLVAIVSMFTVSETALDIAIPMYFITKFLFVVTVVWQAQPYNLNNYLGETRQTCLKRTVNLTICRPDADEQVVKCSEFNC